LVHDSDELLGEERVTTAWNQYPLGFALDEACLEVRLQVLEVGVPLKGLQLFALIILVSLCGFEELRPKVLRLEVFGVFG